jgi:hypothetical protein
LAGNSRVAARWFLAGVLVTCMCSLMLQIMETRILSVSTYYHLAFFAISIAMLGMTAGALAVFYRADVRYTLERLCGLLSSIMAVYAWSVLVSLALILSMAFGAVPKTLAACVDWLIALVVLLPPYVLLGAAVSLALTRSSVQVGLVYGVDLIGAAGGCLVTLLLLSLTDTYTGILLVGAIGAAAGLAFRAASRQGGSAPAPTSSAKPFLSASVALLALLVAAGVNGSLGLKGLHPVVIKGGLEDVSELAEMRWNSFSRVVMSKPQQSPAFMWSASDIAPHVTLDQALLNIDGAAGTAMYRWDGDPRKLDFLRYDETALAYYIRNQGRAAIIGIGGGRDILTASVFGFRDITGVEYNPIFIRLFHDDYRAFDGSDHVAGLTLVNDDARSWFARSDQHFDLIQMSMIDTWAATGAGAFTLSENNLYTVDGWKRFLARLTPTGVFTVSRWYAPENADETARILSLAMATLIELGLPNPRDHIYLSGNGRLSTLIVGRSVLTPAELETLNRTSQALGYAVLAAPGRTSADATFNRILGARTTGELIDIGRRTTLNLTPTWDENPFFFNQLRISNPGTMARIGLAPGVARGNLTATLTLVTLLILSALVTVLVVIYPARGAIAHTKVRTLAWCSAYFLLIGVGFMFVEISLIQRMSIFLGHPIYGLVIVLFSVILATGVGSLVSERAMPLTPAAVVGWPLALAAYVATMPFWLGGVLTAAEPASLIERAAVCVAAVAPGGILMGFMFPNGMRLCERLDTRLTPWLWAVNGAAGVLASSAALLVSIESSLNQALWVGAGAYAALSAVALAVLNLSGLRERPIIAEGQTQTAI